MIEMLPGWYKAPDLNEKTSIRVRLKQKTGPRPQKDGSKRNNGKGRPGHKGPIPAKTCACGKPRGKFRRMCNECRNEWQRRNYAKDPEAQRRANARYYQNRKKNPDYIRRNRMLTQAWRERRKATA